MGGAIMTINYKHFLLYKRLAKRFKLATIERHWERAQGAAANE